MLRQYRHHLIAKQSDEGNLPNRKRPGARCLANSAEKTVGVTGCEFAHVIGKYRVVCGSDFGGNNVPIRIHYAVSGCGSADRPPWHDAILCQASKTWRLY